MMQNQQRQNVKEPVLLQGDFRKVSGISSEIFRQIESVENDHDPSTAAALEVKFIRIRISHEYKENLNSHDIKSGTLRIKSIFRIKLNCALKYLRFCNLFSLPHSMQFTF